MTVEAPTSSLSVDVDLEIAVDGPTGRTTAHVTASGRDVRMWSERPEIVIAGAGPRAGAWLSDTLATTGVRAVLHGPDGPVLRFDPHRDSRLGSLLWGSRYIVVERAGWPVLTRAATLWIREARGLRRTTVFVTAAVVTALGVTGWLRRRSTVR